MGMASDRRPNILALLRDLEKEARESGWRRTQYGWICAFCATQPTVMDDLKAEQDRAAQLDGGQGEERSNVCRPAT